MIRGETTLTKVNSDKSHFISSIRIKTMMGYEIKELTLNQTREFLSASRDLIPETTERIIFEGKDYTSVINIKTDKTWKNRAI